MAPGSVDSPALEAVRARIADQFGLVPSFFMQARAGLAITKRLVTLLDGAISVDASEGNGSSFVVTLPHRDAPTA